MPCIPGAFCKVQEQRQVKDDGAARMESRQRKFDFDLHLVSQPAEDVDVIPAFLVVAPGG